MEEKVVVRKSDLVRAMAKDLGLKIVEVERMYDSFVEHVTDNLADGHEVHIRGFGKFYTTFLPARKGTNFTTKEVINIEARNVPRFSAGDSLKKAVKAGV